MAHASTVATVAAVASSNIANSKSPYSQQKRPTPLDFPDDDDDSEAWHDDRARRLSLRSDDESDSEDSQPSALDSSAALILVHDDSQESQNLHFEFSDDEDGEDNDGDIVSPVFEIRRTSIPPLHSRRVFLYLLSPFLKLGALGILPTADRLPLKYGLPALFVLAISSAFSRQVWYHLARYLRKADLMEILCDTFAKSRGKERQRRIIRTGAKLGTGVFSSLLSVLYLHESIRQLLPYLPQSVWVRLLIVMLCGSTVFFLSLGRSLGSQRVVFASWLSILTYFAWLSCVCYAHAKGVLYVEDGSSSTWAGIFTIAFTFCTSSTLPLYASLKSGVSPAVVTTAKTPSARSFRVLSIFSVFCATLLVLPVVIFAAVPNIPATRSSSVVQVSPPDHFLGVEPTVESVRVALASLAAAILLLGAPQPLLTIPAFPVRIARTTVNLTRTLVVPLIIVLSLTLPLVPLESVVTRAVGVVSAVTFVLGLSSTYLLPCVLHICVHTFKRPVSIVIPRTPMVPPTPSGSGSNSGLLGSSGSTSGLSPSTHAGDASSTDVNELLLRKERALQRRQLRRRIVWDLGVWVQMGVWVVGAAVAAASEGVGRR